jgi:hypothetical protein
VRFIDLKDNGTGNKITAARFKTLVAASSGSSLMSGGNFSRTFPQSSASSSSSSSNGSAATGQPLTELWLGYHIPSTYKLRTCSLPPDGCTLVSDPQLNAFNNKKRADAYEKLALFPSIQEYRVLMEDAFKQCAPTAEVAVIAEERSSSRDDVCYYAYVRTRTNHKVTLKNLKTLTENVLKLLKKPLDWYCVIAEPQASWISDANGLLRPWPVTSNKMVPTAIYKGGVLSAELTQFMTQAAGEQLALALVDEERALTVPQAQLAQLTVFDMVQRVKTAATGSDGTLDSLISYVRTLQIEAGMVSVQELETQRGVLDAKIAALMTQHVSLTKRAAELEDRVAGTKAQISEHQEIHQQLATVRKQAWQSMTATLGPKLQADWVILNKERDAIKEANTLLARTSSEPVTQVRELISYAFKYRGDKAKYVWELLGKQAEEEGFKWSCKRKCDAQA